MPPNSTFSSRLLEDFENRNKITVQIYFSVMEKCLVEST